MAKDYKIVKVNSLPTKFGKPLLIKSKDKYHAYLKPIIPTRKRIKGSDDFNTVQTQFELKEKEKDE